MTRRTDWAIAGNNYRGLIGEFTRKDGYNIALYAGDAGYEVGDASLPGARNRLLMGEGDWVYERDV